MVLVHMVDPIELALTMVLVHMVDPIELALTIVLVHMVGPCRDGPYHCSGP
jgi:hypothetical protein